MMYRTKDNLAISREQIINRNASIWNNTKITFRKNDSNEYVPIHLRNLDHWYDHGELLTHIGKWLKPFRYLEIGVCTGYSLKLMQHYATECYGVDVVIEHTDYKNNVKLFKTTSDDFFQNLSSEIMFDMAFIDGDHEKGQVYRDFINVKDRIIKDGIVLMHDSVPMNERMLDPRLCHNAWEAIAQIKKEFVNDWEILSLPFNPGITIMRKIPIDKQLIWK